MSERYLTILEVSQKQAYIFQSNELKKNILNSAVIAWIMDADYLEETAGDKKLFNKEDNLVYSGGGHTVLEFPTQNQAVCFTKKITKAIRENYPGIEVFARTILYKDEDSPSKNLKELTKALEKKKSERRAAFHQGSFGVEKIDTNTLKPILYCEEKERQMPEKEKKTDKSLIADGYSCVFWFEDLGGTKDESNFIAVVHIDGNAMGKRMERLQHRLENLSWTDYKEKLRAFSESVDGNYKAAYKGMSEYVADNIRRGKLSDLDISGNRFPVRRIITAGDDICFVTEGRIGLECAAVFLDKLGRQKNKVDEEGYEACAGVAIVHQKYPFYKAYELAEMLCGNAKKYGVTLSSDGFGSDVSAIDWHVEFGETKDTLEEIRADYLDTEGSSITGRPYIVRASQSVIDAEPTHDYQVVHKLIQKLQEKESCASGMIKELRNIFKQGQKETEYFIKFHKIDELIKWDLNKDSKVLFDAIELVDTFIALDDKEESN
ncbi:MAG: hypothetical protein K2N34_06510 [Lachnospiraceae bacterium]|nr:hypothetical protein [Lachnospiraceae bacterium]